MRLAIPVFLAIFASGGISQTTTTRVSVSSTGVEANGPTTAVTISESGRWVAMQSAATNLVVGDTNGVDDIFLHDRNWAETSRVSVTTGGIEANGACALPSISGSGDRIAFESTASNLVGGYGPTSQIYVHDRVAGTTVAASPVVGNGASSECAISLDGNWVVFHSSATNLVGGDTNGVADVFLCGLETGTITRVSVSSSGTAGNGPSTRASVSADGRYVTFVSSASNLVAGDTNGAEDVFLHDTQTGITTRASVGSAGTQGNGAAVAGAISPDGGYVAFASDASNLVFGDTNGARDIFVKVLSSGLTVRASVSSAGTQANGGSFFPGLSWYGSEVSFHSLASNLAPGLDSNSARDVFKHDLDTGITTLISADPSGIAAAGTSWLADLDTGGRVVAFQSDAANLVAGDTNGVSDAFVQLKKATWYIDVARTPPGTGTPGSPFTSIQYGIDRPQTVGGDELLVAAGTYYENPDLRGKSLGLKSLSGPSATVIDGGGNGSVLTMVSGENGTIEGFSMQSGGGTYDTSLCVLVGGGVLCRGSSMQMFNCVVANNSAGSGIGYSGGKGIGLYLEGPDAQFVLQDCRIEGNSAFAWQGSIEAGAGIYVSEASLQLTRCVVAENHTGYTGGAYGRGGGVYARNAVLMVEETTFRSNHGDADGGAVYSEGSVLIASDSSFDGNFGYQGGALYLAGGAGSSVNDCVFTANICAVDEGAPGGAICSYDDIVIDRCLFEDNRGGRGGAAYFAGDATVTASSFLRNQTLGIYARPGGAIYTEGDIGVIDCSFVGNKSIFYSIVNHGHAVYGPAYLDRCTIVSIPPILSASGEPEAGVYGATVRNSIVRGAGEPEVVDCIITYSNIQGGYPGTGNIDEDPLFWDPNGGDFHLQSDSPCIDAGDPTSPLDPDGSIADMGAFPFDPDYCPPPTSYCTAGTTTNGCNALISATGTPSATAGSGFDVTVTGVEGQKDGIIFWGKVSQASPWGGGTSYLCIQPPVKRTGAQNSGGAAGSCDGAFELDFNAWMQVNPGKAPGLGEVVYMQAWFRDPPSPKGTSLSDGLRFVVCQ